MDCGSRSAMGNVPSRRRASEVPVASFSGPLASSLAVRSVRRPPRRSCSGIEILPSINLATHSAASTDIIEASAQAYINAVNAIATHKDRGHAREVVGRPGAGA